MTGGRCRCYKIYVGRHGSTTSSGSHIAVVLKIEKGLTENDYGARNNGPRRKAKAGTTLNVKSREQRELME
ncbi:hypothetical protein NDU88_001887 [Pleurodeles waltl]|uniref:Uncharacterized protein n=1 Tax=Pleurodeles waltl TaxID=8319 RepID=A0AAV7LCP2_PLEWA|nr:hypothetical protein NDU88_001887 [Pleurodeles waltl]